MSYAEQLAYIIDHPDDLTARRILADLCDDENMPEQAALLRTQTELSQTPLGEPGIHTGREWREMKREEQALLSERNRQALAGERLYFQQAQFRNGLVTHVTLTVDQFVDHLERFSQMAPITGVTFTELTSGNVQKLADCPHLKQLRALGIECEGSDQLFPVLQPLLNSPNMPDIEELSLKGYLLYREDYELIGLHAHTRGLKRLSINDEHLTQQAVPVTGMFTINPECVALLSHLQQLRSLEMVGGQHLLPVVEPNNDEPTANSILLIGHMLNRLTHLRARIINLDTQDDRQAFLRFIATHGKALQELDLQGSNPANHFFNPLPHELTDGDNTPDLRILRLDYPVDTESRHRLANMSDGAKKLYEVDLSSGRDNGMQLGNMFNIGTCKDQLGSLIMPGHLSQEEQENLKAVYGDRVQFKPNRM